MIKHSVYPSDIDERVFFQDINLNQVPKYEEFQRHLRDGAYSRASVVLENMEATTYSAWLLNYFTEKLINIEKEANRKNQEIKQYADIAKEIASNLYLTSYSSTEPTASKLPVGYTWIS